MQQAVTKAWVGIFEKFDKYPYQNHRPGGMGLIGTATAILQGLSLDTDGQLIETFKRTGRYKTNTIEIVESEQEMSID